MTNRAPDDLTELEAIEAIETSEDAIKYLVARGFTRDQAEAFVLAIGRAPDDPSWPRKDQ